MHKLCTKQGFFDKSMGQFSKGGFSPKDQKINWLLNTSSVSLSIKLTSPYISPIYLILDAIRLLSTAEPQ